MPPKTFKRKVLSPLMASDVQIAANNKRQRLNLQGSQLINASVSRLTNTPEATQGKENNPPNSARPSIQQRVAMQENAPLPDFELTPQNYGRNVSFKISFYGQCGSVFVYFT